MKTLLLAGAAIFALSTTAHAADCDSTREVFQRAVAVMKATVFASPGDPISYQATIDAQVNGEWLMQHNCVADRARLAKFLGYTQQLNALASQYRANERLLNH